MISKNNPLLPSNSIVRDEEKISDIYNFLKKVWNVKSLTPNPCALPISLERRHLEFLKKESSNYTVAEKSDGIRYILVLGKYRKNGEHYSVMLDRNLTAYEIALAARDEVFEGGTVMDGELIWEYYSSVHPPAQLYLIFDALWYCGVDCQTKTYIDRLNMIHSIFYIQQNEKFVPETWFPQASEYAQEKKIVSLGNAHNLMFSAKSCQSISNIDILVRNLNKFHHASDGLLFTPINERVRRGRHQTMFKWKQRHTIDVVLDLHKTTDSLWNIEILLINSKFLVSAENLVSFKNEKVRFRIVRGNFMRSMLEHLEKKKVTFHEVLVEALCTPPCLSVEEGNLDLPNMNTWNLEPLALRRDKNVPNSLQTIEKTLINVTESITMEELVEVLSSKKETLGSLTPHGERCVG